MRAQSHATKRYLAVERPQMMRVERIGPVLFCVACSCVAANHSSDISRRRLLTKWRTERSPSIKKWRDELTCIKSQQYTPPCIIQYRIYTSMDISAKPIAAAMGKGWDDKCEVVGQDSFASLTSCRSSNVACVRSTVAGHSNTDIMTPVVWLWCHSSVRLL